MNLVRLKRRRLPVAAGDVFVVKPEGCDYYYGRVINPNVQMHTWYGILVYLYDAHSPEKTPIPELSVKRLLVPPLIVERGYWTRGIFENVGSRPLTSIDHVPQHCFWSVGTRVYVDEHGAPIERHEPCGMYYITTIDGVSRQLTKALGL